MIKANFENLVESCVIGQVMHPRIVSGNGTLASAFDGKPCVPIVQAGVTLNVRTGDRAFSWAWGEKVMPGATIQNSDPACNSALNLLACLGNEATIIEAALDSKDSKTRGQTGVVVGKDIGLGCVTVHFPKRVLDRLVIGDRIQIRAVGQGLSLPSHPGITVTHCGPQLLKAVNPAEKSGRLRVPVACIIPGKLMAPEGGGTGSRSGCEIQSNSHEVIKEYKLENLRLGDLVAIADYDTTFGPRWHSGAMTVGAVVHGASNLSGQGVGVTTLFTSAEGLVEPIITRKANIADLMGLT
ncbi:MAG TPA: DUF4438 domain-containing protein [Planctomycetota bacterium]|nr:DUF4438 domain-containing protein [Planctomycetota bacterium]